MHRKVVIIPGRGVKNYDLITQDDRRQRIIIEQAPESLPEPRRRLPEKLPTGHPNFLPRTPNPFTDKR